MAKSRQQKKLERKQRKSKMRAAQYAEAARRKGHKNVATVTRNKKANPHKSGKYEQRVNIRREEANTRAAKHSGHLGTKEKVKRGIITACEGLQVFSKSLDSKTKNWLTKKAKAQKC